jgi:hypothetical protein
MVRWGMISSLSEPEIFRRAIRAVLLSIVGACLAFAQTGSHTVPAMSGELVAVQEGSISIRSDKGTKTFQIDRNSTIWRGHFVDVHQLHLGDEIDLRYRVSASGTAIATAVWANIDRWAGTITKVLPDRIQIAITDDDSGPIGQATILFDRYTVFNEGTPKDFQIGNFLEVVGVKLGQSQMEASRVLHMLGR